MITRHSLQISLSLALGGKSISILVLPCAHFYDCTLTYTFLQILPSLYIESSRTEHHTLRTMSSPITFITGATGFIGSHVVKNALAAGIRVRLSVRKEEQIETLKQLFSAEPNQLEFVVIPDISNPEAFKGKLDGVEHVLHLASPMPGKGEDFQSDYLKPAVEGTESVLEAAKASGSVKRVVVTSSVLAVIPLGQMNATDLYIKGESMLQKAYWEINRFLFLADFIVQKRIKIKT